MTINQNDLMQWGPTRRYLNGFCIGSDGEDGEHLRDESGWPYSIYKEAIEIGASDAVLCNGIQNIGDAVRLRDLLNSDFADRFGEC